MASIEPSAPKDFDEFWQRVLAELGTIPLAAEEEELALRSNEFCTVYAVRYTGLGAYRLFGYLSVPHGEGPFPTLVHLPQYRSVVEVLPQGDASDKRSRYIVFSAAARGQRNADKPYAASFPGLLTDGIETPEDYVFRGVVADCCRALDYVLARPEVDQQRVALVAAGDMPLLAAALRPGATHLVATPQLFHDPLERAEHTDEYPLEELNDYLRLYPERRQAVERTLAYFDPRSFAPRVEAASLLWGDPAQLAPLAAAMAPAAEVRPSENSRYKDGLFQERWLARQLGFDQPVLPAHWR